MRHVYPFHPFAIQVQQMTYRDDQANVRSKQRTRTCAGWFRAAHMPSSAILGTPGASWHFSAPSPSWVYSPSPWCGGWCLLSPLQSSWYDSRGHIILCLNKRGTSAMHYKAVTESKAL